MKHNILIKKENGGYKAITLKRVFNDEQAGFETTENDLIQNIDERLMSPTKLLVTRFLTFLGNRRLTLEKLKALPKAEQRRLRKEFVESY